MLSSSVAVSLLLPCRQASLHGELHGFLDWNSHDPCIPVDPPVGVQDLVLSFAQLAQIVARIGLQARFGRQLLPARGKRILGRQMARFAAVEIVEQQPNHQVNEDGRDEQYKTESKDSA